VGVASVNVTQTAFDAAPMIKNQGVRPVAGPIRVEISAVYLACDQDPPLRVDVVGTRNVPADVTIEPGVTYVMTDTMKNIGINQRPPHCNVPTPLFTFDVIVDPLHQIREITQFNNSLHLDCFLQGGLCVPFH